MKILLSPDVYLRLEMVKEVVGSREFSGYGFIERKGDDFYVYDIELLDVGNEGWTEFDSRTILEVMNREDHAHMKLWFHRHPLGDGTPGPHNWSATDNNTCTNEPLGCPDPDHVKWALAMVLTPGGWVGRVDRFKNGESKTEHIPVEVDIDLAIVDKAKTLLKAQKEQEDEFIPTRIQRDEDDPFDTAHADIDEALNILTIAEFQIKEGYINEAVDSISWAQDVGFYYQHNAYVGHRAKGVLQESRRLLRQIEEVNHA